MQEPSSSPSLAAAAQSLYTLSQQQPHFTFGTHTNIPLPDNQTHLLPAVEQQQKYVSFQGQQVWSLLTKCRAALIAPDKLLVEMSLQAQFDEVTNIQPLFEAVVLISVMNKSLILFLCRLPSQQTPHLYLLGNSLTGALRMQGQAALFLCPLTTRS